MTDDDERWPDAVVELLLDGGVEPAAAVLREQVAAGVDRSVLLVELESLGPLFRGEDHFQDGLRELMDRLAGWCPPSARI